MRKLSSRYIWIFTIVTLTMVSIQHVCAQSKRVVLERKKNRLKEDISFKDALLKKNDTQKSNTLNQLILLRAKIVKRVELVATISSEVKYISRQIEKNEKRISDMEREVIELKDEYARMIQFAYRNRSSYNKVMYVFASNDFNQAYKRLRYFQQYAVFRKKQTQDIKRLESILIKKNTELMATRAEKWQLLTVEKKQKEILAREKIELQRIYIVLQGKEKDLKKAIKEKENESRQMQIAIDRIIAREVRLAQKKNETKSGEWSLTPDAIALANGFTANKGRLPWPVEKGTITDNYGVHSHPVLKTIKINNHGIGISTNKGAKARAVFAGEISRVIVIPGAGKAVIIRHGDYLTVYGNLNKVFVSAGDKVVLKQLIGEVITIDGKTEIQFEIHKGIDAHTLDPASWLFKAY